MKKENIIVLISAAALVVSSTILATIHSANEGYPDVKLEGESGQFLAVSNSVYDIETGCIEVKVRTNAPNGSILKISPQHLYAPKEMSEFAIVKNGKAQAEVEIDSNLPAIIIPVRVTMDMSENQYSQNAINEYGVNGEKFVGEDVFLSPNGPISTVISEELFFPNENSYYNEQFYSILYSTILQNFGNVFESITPAENGSWTEMNIKITELYSKEENWSTMTDELLEDFYALFKEMAVESKAVSKNEDMKITFYSNNGDVLAKNY